mgnify:CR=1 FL=1
MNFMKKRFAIVTLSLALAAGSAMTSFAAGFVGTKDGVKYQWGDGPTALITGYSTKTTGSFSATIS